jgi:hypothetical protein
MQENIENKNKLNQDKFETFLATIEEGELLKNYQSLDEGSKLIIKTTLDKKLMSQNSEYFNDLKEGCDNLKPLFKDSKEASGLLEGLSNNIANFSKGVIEATIEYKQSEPRDEIQKSVDLEISTPVDKEIQKSSNSNLEDFEK